MPLHLFIYLEGTFNVKLIAIWIGSYAIYVLAVHFGASEGLAALTMGVILAESCISWAHSREVLIKETCSNKNSCKKAAARQP